MAAVSVCVVVVVALAQAPELRWYASGLLGSDAWLTWLFGHQSAAMAQPSFPGFSAPSSFLIVLLEVFSIGLFACAVAAEYVGIVFERLSAHTALARTEAERAQELWSELIERLPLPALLIDPASLRIVACSDFAGTYLGGGEIAARRPRSVQSAVLLVSRHRPRTHRRFGRRSAADRHPRLRTSCE